MSSVVKKVKEAIRGHHDQQDNSDDTERRSSQGKMKTTDGEKDKPLSAGSTNVGQDNRGLAEHGTTGTLGALNPSGTAEDHPNAMGNLGDHQNTKPQKSGFTDAEHNEMKGLSHTDDGFDGRGTAGTGADGTRESFQQEKQGQRGTDTSFHTMQGQPGNLTAIRPLAGGTAANNTAASSGGGAGGGGGGAVSFVPVARVIHKCVKCGEDNDISDHFKGNAAYRVAP